MARFKVVGNHTVDGVKPGRVVHIADPVRARRLVRSGHIKPAPQQAKPKGR